MIVFRLRPQSGIPLYLQIIQQVKQALQMGLLREGDRLPTIKEVIATVAINPNTVARAYRELESEGLVRGRTGVGTFVLKHPDGPLTPSQAALARDLEIWIDQARKSGVSDESIEALMLGTLHKGGRG